MEVAELPLLNWYAAAFPAGAAWERWLKDVAGAMLLRPGKMRVRLAHSDKTTQKFDDVVVDEEGVTLGRDESNKVVLPQPAITRFHARIWIESGRLMIEDLNSTMGTLVNERRMVATGRAEITDGDEIVIFPHRFVVKMEREWEPERDVQVGESFACAGSAAEFHGSIPAGWSVFALTVEPVGAQLSLVAADAFLEGLVSRALGPVGRNAGLLPSSEAVIELLLLAGLERAQRELQFPFQFSLGRRGVRPNVGERGMAVGATARFGTLRGAFRVFVPFASMERMQQVWAGPPGELPGLAMGRFGVSAGSVELTLEEQKLLEPGDVVLYTAKAAVLYPGRDDEGWSAEMTGAAQVRIGRRLAMSEAQGDGLTPFAELPLRVQILLGEVEMTLAEAGKLAPGAVLTMTPGPVRLAVNGRAVGTGEIVEIEGRMGVKILAWSKV